MSSYLATISSSTSTNLSSEFRSANSPVLKPKSKFITSYDRLLDQITESAKTNRQKENDFLSSLQPKNEKEHLKTFSSNIEKRKANPFQQEIFKAKLSLLTGSTLDSLNFTRKKEKEAKTTRNTNTITTQDTTNRKTSVAMKELRHYLKKKNDLPVSSKLFKDSKGTNNERLFDTFSNSNNNFLAKIRQTFPEYINIKTKGQSFIMNSNGMMNSKINQLRRQVNKM